MPILRKTKTSASGATISASTLYEPLVSFAVEHMTYNSRSRLLGSHEAVQARPAMWVECDLDGPSKHRLRYSATPPPPQHESWSQPTPIPPARRLIATKDFELSVPAARALIRVHAGDVIDAADGLYADVIRRHPERFRRADAPGEAA